MKNLSKIEVDNSYQRFWKCCRLCLMGYAAPRPPYAKLGDSYLPNLKSESNLLLAVSNDRLPIILVIPKPSASLVKFNSEVSSRVLVSFGFLSTIVLGDDSS